MERKYQAMRRPHYVKRNAMLLKIPKFWGTALQNHPVLSPLILERDSEVLEYLTDVRPITILSPSTLLTFYIPLGHQSRARARPASAPAPEPLHAHQPGLRIPAHEASDRRLPASAGRGGL